MGEFRMCCGTCEHARYALASQSNNLVHKDLVCCSFYTCFQEVVVDPEGYEHYQERPNPMDNGLIYHDVYEGWADLRRRPDGPKSSGILTNCCMILHKTAYCNFYRKREDTYVKVTNAVSTHS